MELYKTIEYLFPDIDFLDECVIQDDADGQGEYIKSWNCPEPQPTIEELELSQAAAGIWYDKQEAKQELAQWDREGDTSRMAEDLMRIGIAKGTITANDFASQADYDAVVAKLAKREAKRAEI
jgi:hypothetical protein